jgi:hypothetical protein
MGFLGLSLGAWSYLEIIYLLSDANFAAKVPADRKSPSKAWLRAGYFWRNGLG